MDWKSSHGLALLPCGNLAVTDWTDGGKIHIISVDWRNNAILKMNVMEGFVRPVQISVNKNEDLLVAEGQLFGQYEGRCVKIIENKKIKMKIGPELGNRHCFVNPSGVCVDRDGNILVTDEGQNCITMFNPNASLSAYVVNHELQGPFGICITNEGHLAVADCYHSCVKLYRYR
ncbi:tripartite motif-containing protein 3-like [Acipenser ruthenus]|uniref:tripartite motif-containing protein 3-like n=1 Tax=Acipenser ruthenus TaxID=7906 RepID=UPI002741FF9E|nr:tripartite motif-containing protein 3-like [Acipenser ruthenus]